MMQHPKRTFRIEQATFEKHPEILKKWAGPDASNYTKEKSLLFICVGVEGQKTMYYLINPLRNTDRFPHCFTHEDDNGFRWHERSYDLDFFVVDPSSVEFSNCKVDSESFHDHKLDNDVEKRIVDHGDAWRVCVRCNHEYLQDASLMFDIVDKDIEFDVFQDAILAVHEELGG